jgi:hypothetical protein
LVHETVRVLARQDRRRTDTVQGLAAWCGDLLTFGTAFW